MKHSLIWATGLLALFCGCQSTAEPEGNLPQDVRSAVYLCSGGSYSQVSASLQAKIGRTIHEGGTISAELERDIRGAFFRGADPNNEQARRAYEAYLGCIRDIRR